MPVLQICPFPHSRRIFPSNIAVFERQSTLPRTSRAPQATTLKKNHNHDGSACASLPCPEFHFATTKSQTASATLCTTFSSVCRRQNEAGAPEWQLTAMLTNATPQTQYAPTAMSRRFNVRGRSVELREWRYRQRRARNAACT